LGGAPVHKDYPSAKMADALVSDGMLVVAAASNSGSAGLFQISSPAISTRALAIASMDNTLLEERFISLTNVPKFPTAPCAEDPAAGKFPDAPVRIVATGAIDSIQDGCAPFPSTVVLKGAVALIRRGTCPFTAKVKNAVEAGAEAVLIYNNVPGDLKGSVGNSTVGVGFINGDIGVAIAQSLANGEVSVQFNGRKMVPHPNAGQPSEFSSWGPGPQLELKPDLGAPGGDMFSAWPQKVPPFGGYNTISGTSMASPYLAGVLALELQKNGKFSDDERWSERLRDRLQATARPTTSSNSSVPYPVYKQGAGLVQAFDFLKSSISITPARLALKEQLPGTSSQAQFTISQKKGDPIQYSLRYRSAKSLSQFGGVKTADLKWSDLSAKVTFKSDHVTVSSGRPATVSVTVETPGDWPAGKWFISGWVELHPRSNSNSQILRVPLTLYRGDYSTHAITLPKAKPILSNSLLAEWDFRGPLPPQAPIYTDQSQATQWSLNGTDRPLVIAGFIHPVRLVKIMLYSNSTQEQLGEVGRSSHIPGIAMLPVGDKQVAMGWTGSFTNINGESKMVEDGVYYWQLEVAKPSTSNRAWDSKENYISVYRTPSLIISRPKNIAGAAKITTNK
jgi:hypothetical protein